MAQFYVQIHDPAGERVAAYDGMDANTITALITNAGFTFSFIDAPTYAAFVLAHLPAPLTAAQIVTLNRALSTAELGATTQPLSVLQKAILLVILDEINVIRALLVPAAVARTPAQFKTAILNKIAAGSAD